MCGFGTCFAPLTQMASSFISIRCFASRNPFKIPEFSLPYTYLCSSKPHFSFKTKLSFPKSRFVSGNGRLWKRLGCISCKAASTTSVSPKGYEFSDVSDEVELRIHLGGKNVQSARDVFLDVGESSLTVRMKSLGSIVTLVETIDLYEKIKPAETIWYIDENQLVVNLKKLDPDLRWPDIMESWESLTTGVLQLLKGTSIYIVGCSTDINEKVAQELAIGLGYTPLYTNELLEAFAKETVDSLVVAEGVDSVAEVEAAILESLSSHARAVVATLGGQQGAAGRAEKWRFLYAGFTLWLSQSEARDEALAKEEGWRHIQEGNQAYSNAEVVVKLGGWDDDHAKVVAQTSLSALKQLILSDKKLPDKKSLYIRLGCRGDWPNIKPPGWDPSARTDASSNAL